jgi:aspartyl protease family protein
LIVIKKHRILATVFSGLLALPVAAAEISLLLLSPDKAILLIGDQRRMLSPGDTSPEGVALVAIENDTATVRIGDATQRLRLARSMGSTAAPAAGAAGTGKPEHRVYIDSSGMYRTAGSVNGFPVSFIVDTGASTVVLNAREARRLGLDYRMDSKIVAVTTASGVERGYLVKLQSVKVGPIELFGVEAIVVDSNFPVQALLGMSFLGRLESERTPSMLVLRKIH